MTVVRVILPVPLTQTFDYLLPDDMPRPVPGARVIVPFGRQKQAVGIVAELAETSTFSPEKLKPVIACPDDDTLFPGICGRC